MVTETTTPLAAARAALPSLFFMEDHEAGLFASLKTLKEANESGLLKIATGFDKVVPTADGSGIAAVQSRIEFLSFGDEPLVTEGKSVLQWSAELDARVVLAMRAHLKEAWTKYSHADLTTLADKFPSQISCLVLNLRFTADAEKALSRGNLQKLKSALDDLERAIGSSSRAIRKEMNDFVKIRLRNLQMVALGYRRRLIRMVKAIESGSSFQDTWALWRSFLRSYYDEKDSNLVTMECGEGEVPYGFHFNGGLLLVETDLTQRAYAATLGSLGAKGTRTVFAWGPPGTGKTETQKDLATHLGYRHVVYNCKSNLIANNYDRLVEASKANPRCVMVFDEFNCGGSTHEVMSYLSAVQRIPRKDRPLFQSYTYNTGNKSATADISMEALFARGATSIPMSRPDLRVIAQAMLCNEGFVYHDKLGTKAISYYTWCKEHLSKQPHYDFGLRNIKASFATAGYYLRKTFNPDCACEIQCVLDAVRLNTMARMSDADLALAEAQLSKIFEDGEARSWEAMLTDAKQREFVAGAEDQVVRARLCQLLLTQEFRHGICTLAGNMELTFKGVQDCAGTLGYHLVHLDLSGDKFNVDHVVGKFAGHPGTESKTEDSESWEDVSRGTWKDGVLAEALRAGSPEGKRTWIVLTGMEVTKENSKDGSLWERFNTLLDDNRVLCLPSGERISLHRDARIVVVLPSVSNASPALVSRMGVINFGVQSNGACSLM